MILASTLGIASSAMFVGANLGISYISVPALLLPLPPTPLPSPANAHNTSSPTVTSVEKPATKPSHLARQWQDMYKKGARAGPAASFLSSGCWLFAIRQLPAGARLEQRLLLVAAGLSLAIVPFTLGVMKRTNGELLRRAEAATRGEEENSKADAQKGTVESYPIHDLLRWWATLNTL